MSKVWGINDIVPPELFDEYEQTTAADVPVTVTSGEGEGDNDITGRGWWEFVDWGDEGEWGFI
jgi:hypothetical protein